MIILFSDFDQSDIYVGQLHLVAATLAPGVPVIDFFHNAPTFNPVAAGYLLAALSRQIPEGAVVVAVVDPGVGGGRRPVALKAGNRWFVGPDNGLLDVVAAQSDDVQFFEILWLPAQLSDTFHGRDLFLPFATRLHSGIYQPDELKLLSTSPGRSVRGDLNEIIYCDHYGNLITGIRSSSVAEGSLIRINNTSLRYVRTFEEASTGSLFWYRNSMGLVEIAANIASAKDLLKASVGDTVDVQSA